MYVLQAQEETTGPFAFQLLQLAKLRAAPQVSLLHVRNSYVTRWLEKQALDARQVVYVSSKSDDVLLDSLRSCSEQGAACDVRLEKSRLFSYDAALRCLQLLHVSDMPQNLDGHGHTNW